LHLPEQLVRKRHAPFVSLRASVVELTVETVLAERSCVDRCQRRHLVEVAF
jgi:hypothetical protein